MWCSPSCRDCPGQTHCQPGARSLAVPHLVLHLLGLSEPGCAASAHSITERFQLDFRKNFQHRKKHPLHLDAVTNQERVGLFGGVSVPNIGAASEAGRPDNSIALCQQREECLYHQLGSARSKQVPGFSPPGHSHSCLYALTDSCPLLEFGLPCQLLLAVILSLFQLQVA